MYGDARNHANVNAPSFLKKTTTLTGKTINNGCHHLGMLAIVKLSFSDIKLNDSLTTTPTPVAKAAALRMAADCAAFAAPLPLPLLEAAAVWV